MNDFAQLMNDTDELALNELGDLVALDGVEMLGMVYHIVLDAQVGGSQSELVEYYFDVPREKIFYVREGQSVIEWNGMEYEVVRVGEPDDRGWVRLKLRPKRNTFYTHDIGV